MKMKMKMLDFIKNYNTHKLTDEQCKKVFAHENFSGLSERLELSFTQTEKCFIEAYAFEYFDEAANDYITCMICKLYEITDEDAWHIFEATRIEIEISEQKKQENHEAESIFKSVATYKFDTDTQFKDFLITLIKNFDCDISA